MPKLTGEQKRRLETLVTEMRKVAAPIGPLHSWWDLIFDIEASLSDNRMLIAMEADELIAEAESYFIRTNRPIPV